MRMRVDKAGQRKPAGQFLRIARARYYAFARKAVQEYP
jgi:hypothetical protein